MIKSYKYIETVHSKLHDFIIAFFNRIEFETGNFDDSFFDAEFIEIVNRHPKILKQRCRRIYEKIKKWDQYLKTQLCNQIRDSNEIEKICQGYYVPQTIDSDAIGLNKLLRQLFLDLYKQVLDGDGYRAKYNTTLRDHFNVFSKRNEDVTLCPICGIGELKKHQDETRDQYDHYLPKSLYPFSSVNFKNLVPSCKECNSFDAKGEKDTVAVSTGKFFYPYDESHKGITLDINVATDDIDIENMAWDISFFNSDEKNEEIESWKNIYDIESRYRGFIKGRIVKWYRHYWDFMNGKSLAHLSYGDRKLTYITFLETDESLGLNFIRKPALDGFISGSVLARAELEAKQYS